MNQPKSSKDSKGLALPSIIIIGLIWAFGLLGLGLWRNLYQSEQIAQPSQDLPDQGFSDYSTFEQVRDVPTGKFKYSGSPDWSPIRLVVDSAIQSERREYQLSYVQPIDQPANSTTAIALLLQGKLDLVQSGRPLRTAERKQAQENGYQLQQTPVAVDGIAIAVHPSLPMKGLTLPEVVQIYRGQITNWQQLGGPDLEIQPYSLSTSSEAIVDLFSQKVMKEASYGDRLEFFPTVTTALRRLATTPGGIFFGSAAEIVSQCSIKPLPIGQDAQARIAPYQFPYISSTNCPNQRNRINTQAFLTQQYPLTHQLYVIHRANGAKDAGNAYVQLLRSAQGQELVDKAGFVSILKPSPTK